jgi:serine/threonine protein kinase/CheY-like chemotaxis protein
MAKILIADDSLIVRKSYESMLSLMGHEVISCNDGKEAVSSFLENSPELLILDVDMPVMDGLEACREIRKHPAGGSVPIIIVSALDEENDILNGLNAGADDYLVKPVKEAHLVAKLKTTLDISSLHKRDFELVRDHSVLADKYRIEKMLGYGPHSVVFLVSNIKSGNKSFALKLFRDSVIPDDMVKSYIEEAKKFGKIDSPYVSKIYDIGKYYERVFLVLEYADEADLMKVLKHKKMSELEATQMGLDIVRGIKTLRDNGLVHLDITPGNVLISGGQYKLGDFGIVVSRKSAEMPLNAENWSTTGYISPECLTMESPITSKSDIYSLGVTLYQAITGDNPLYADRPSVGIFRQINLVPPSLHSCDQNITEYFSNAVQAMLEKDPEQRPSEEELESIFSNLIEYNKCRLALTQVERKKGSTRMVEDDLSMQPVRKDDDMADRDPDFLRTRMVVLEEIFSKAGINRPTKKNAGQMIEIGNLIDSLKSLTKIQFKIIALSVLLLLVSVTAGIVGYNIFNRTETPAAVIQGPPMAVICKKCNFTEERRIKDISQAKCTRCSGQVAAAMKCSKCNQVFPLPEINNIEKMTPEEYSKASETLYKCPSCGSAKFAAVPVSNPAPAQ